jgi:hypothetical protein
VNAILSGIQLRNLEASLFCLIALSLTSYPRSKFLFKRNFDCLIQVAWGKPVLDRVGLIIEIFNAHAETKEAKLQVSFFI